MSGMTGLPNEVISRILEASIAIAAEHCSFSFSFNRLTCDYLVLSRSCYAIVEPLMYCHIWWLPADYLTDLFYRLLNRPTLAYHIRSIYVTLGSGGRMEKLRRRGGRAVFDIAGQPWPTAEDEEDEGYGHGRLSIDAHAMRALWAASWPALIGILRAATSLTSLTLCFRNEWPFGIASGRELAMVLRNLPQLQRFMLRGLERQLARRTATHLPFEDVGSAALLDAISASGAQLLDVSLLCCLALPPEWSVSHCRALQTVRRLQLETQHLAVEHHPRLISFASQLPSLAHLNLSVIRNDIGDQATRAVELTANLILATSATLLQLELNTYRSNFLTPSHPPEERIADAIAACGQLVDVAFRSDLPTSHRPLDYLPQSMISFSYIAGSFHRREDLISDLARAGRPNLRVISVNRSLARMQKIADPNWDRLKLACTTAGIRLIET